MNAYRERPMAGTTERCRKKKQHKSNTFWALAATLTVVAWIAALVWNATL